jgi:hypothetical protein
MLNAEGEASQPCVTEILCRCAARALQKGCKQRGALAQRAAGVERRVRRGGMTVNTCQSV